MFDVFNTTKLVVAVGCAVALTGLAAVARLRRHPVLPPRSPAVVAAAIFLVLAVLAAATAPAPGRAVLGGSGAHAGLALYLSCGVVFLGAARVYGGNKPRLLANAVLVAAAPVVAYGAAQALGLDPLRWRSTSGGPPVFSTMGNANFLSAWSAIAIVFAVWGAVKQPAAWARAGCAALAVAAAGVALASQSIQGPVAAVAGLTILGAARLSETGRHAPRVAGRLVLLRALPVLALVAGGVVLATRGDAGGSLASRMGKWEAALAMGRARPLTGFGLDLFGDWYHRYRPAYDAVERGVAHTADAAHSVPLQLLAGGGVPLLLAYLAFVLATGWMAVRAVRGASGDRRLLLGAIAGGWVAYQMQSMVSIDVPALAVMHWTLAGVLVAGATRAAGTSRHHHRPWSPPTAAAVTVLAGLVALALALPVRADIAARRGIRLGLQGEYASAERAFGIALRLNPWEPEYAVALARQRVERGDERLGLEAYHLALSRDPASLPVTLEAARTAARTGQPDAAADLYAIAVTLDPQSPDLLAEAARQYLRVGEPQEAVRLLERAVEVDPRARWQQRLDRARRWLD